MQNQNHIMIHELIACLHSENLLKSQCRLFSTSFKFDSPEQGGLNFEQLCSYLSTISHMAQARVEKITHAGIVYRAAIVCNIVDNTEKYYADLKMDVIFKIKDELIQSVHTEYVATREELEYFEKTKISSSLVTNVIPS